MVYDSIFVLVGAHKLSVYKHCGVEKYPPYYLRSSYYIKILYIHDTYIILYISGCRIYLLKKCENLLNYGSRSPYLLVKKS